MRRQIEHKSSRGVRRADYYDSHSACLRCDTHKTRVEEADDFMESCDRLEAEFAALSVTARRLSSGYVVVVDVLPVAPDACTPYALVKLNARVSAYSRQREWATEETYVLADLTAESVLELLRPKGEEIVAEWRAMRERGDI